MSVNPLKPNTIRLSDDLLDKFRYALVTYGKVKVIGLGMFYLRECRERKTINAFTGKGITISPYKKVAFKATRIIKELLK